MTELPIDIDYVEGSIAPEAIRYRVHVHSSEYLRRFLALPRADMRPPLGPLVIDMTINTKVIPRVFLDSGSTVNIMPLQVFTTLSLGPIDDLSPYGGTLLLATSEYTRQPLGIAREVMCWICDLFFSVDFVVMDTAVHSNRDMVIPVILRTPFPATSRACIDHSRDEVILDCNGHWLRVDMKSNRGGFDRAAMIIEDILDVNGVDSVEIERVGLFNSIVIERDDELIKDATIDNVDCFD